MNKEEFENLQPGDIVRGKLSKDGYIVTSNYGYRVTAIRAIDMTNPDEWLLIQKSQPTPHDGNSAEDCANDMCKLSGAVCSTHCDGYQSPSA